MPVNRGACCHVAGDLDWDKNGNLWLVTGDDTAAGSGDAGNWGQSIDQRTDENQTIRVTNATGGTFTLTFNGQTTAPPLTVEAMLRLLHVAPGQRILDVGSGSGWTTALLAQLTGPAGRVYGVEIEPELATWGAGNITDHKNASIVRAVPGVLGLPDTAPYDRILVSAEPPSVPQELVDQLADPGIMVIPVRGVMLRVVLNAGELTTTQHGYYRFVPLR